jgi:DNA-binding IclR family transcriptional regulator
VLATADGDRHNASDLARATQIPLQTVHRILRDLADGGLVLHDPSTRAWSLGPMALTLGSAAQRHITWTGVARTVLERITTTTRETTILTLREGAYASHTDIVESPQRLRLTEHVGLRLPLTVGASRRAILASLPDSDRATVLTSLAADGVTIEHAATTRQCQEIRKRGYAISRGEVSDHTVGVAVPVFRRDGAEASLLVAGPEHRMSQPVIADAATLLEEQANWLHEIWGDAPNGRQETE